MKRKRVRIDHYLVENSYYRDLEKARRAIMAGEIFVGQERINSASEMILNDQKITVKRRGDKYVSRAGYKLEKALAEFELDLKDKIMIDIGSSTGGFSDCGLQNGVKHVYAVDVGYGQLDWKLRSDERVTVLERTNFRHLEIDLLKDGRPDFASIDVSFISLKIILAKLKEILLPDGQLVALIKPQFEAAREDVAPGGLVKDQRVHVQVIMEQIKMAQDLGYELLAITYSPITGAEGNIEFLAHWLYSQNDKAKEERRISEIDWEEMEKRITDLVMEAHRVLAKKQ